MVSPLLLYAIIAPDDVPSQSGGAAVPYKAFSIALANPNLPLAALTTIVCERLGIPCVAFGPRSCTIFRLDEAVHCSDPRLLDATKDPAKVFPLTVLPESMQTLADWIPALFIANPTHVPHLLIKAPKDVALDHARTDAQEKALNRQSTISELPPAYSLRASMAPPPPPRRSSQNAATIFRVNVPAPAYSSLDPVVRNGNPYLPPHIERKLGSGQHVPLPPSPVLVPPIRMDSHGTPTDPTQVISPRMSSHSRESTGSANSTGSAAENHDCSDPNLKSAFGLDGVIRGMVVDDSGARTLGHLSNLPGAKCGFMSQQTAGVLSGTAWKPRYYCLAEGALFCFKTTEPTQTPNSFPYRVPILSTTRVGVGETGFGVLEVCGVDDAGRATEKAWILQCESIPVMKDWLAAFERAVAKADNKTDPAAGATQLPPSRNKPASHPLRKSRILWR
ncbi:hypothetical protein HKX48_007678 [Thoreauomyces humboldtii]|nr:hypothetical protein HKX48_007678 [Thoreauomyces humboldtii]